MSLTCTKCDRSFGSQGALKQHLRDSPAHISSVACQICNRSFVDEQALEQHLRDSPAHTSSFNCQTCERSFGSKQALEQHLRDSPAHQRNRDTPLDVFFRSFPTFTYNPSLPPAESYADLTMHEGWRRGQVESREAWSKYQDALQSELRMWYGAEDDLPSWHALCRAIGIVPLPQTCGECKEAARRTHVNIVDLIEWGRNGGGENVQTFPNVTELRAYTKNTGKIFRIPHEQGNGNIVLRHLLRRIF